MGFNGCGMRSKMEKKNYILLFLQRLPYPEYSGEIQHLP